MITKGKTLNLINHLSLEFLLIQSVIKPKP